MSGTPRMDEIYFHVGHPSEGSLRAVYRRGCEMERELAEANRALAEATKDAEIQLRERGLLSQHVATKDAEIARLTSSVGRLVAALTELEVATSVRYPAREDGIDAQNAWAERITAAHDAARAALSQAQEKP